MDRQIQRTPRPVRIRAVNDRSSKSWWQIRYDEKPFYAPEVQVVPKVTVTFE